MKKINHIIMLATALVVLCCTTQPTITIKDIAGAYPTIIPDTAIDEYWGKTIIDPYRNLENMKDTAVMHWFEAQKKFYDTIINRVTGIDSLKSEIDRYKREESNWIELPRPVGNKLYYTGYSYEKSAFFIMFQNSLNETPELIFDTDSINKLLNTTNYINYIEPSPNGEFIVFGLSSSGDEQAVMHIIETKTRKILNERINNAADAMPQWLPDNSGFFYMEYLLDINNPGGESRPKAVKFHKLGTPSNSDKIIVSKDETPQLTINEIDFPLLYVFPDTDKVLLAVYHGTSDYAAIYCATLAEVNSKPANKINWKKIISAEDLVPYFGLVEDNLYYMSYKNSSNGNVIRLNLDDSSDKQVLFETKNEVLNDLIQTNSAIYITSLENGVHKLKAINIKDNSLSSVNLANNGSIIIRPYRGAYSNYQNTNALFFKLESWISDEKVYSLEPGTHKVKETDLLPANKYSVIEDMEFYQVEVSSHDGVMVPLTIVHKKGLKRDGKSPAFVEAYGFYGATTSPAFRRSIRLWLERGGVYAYAHVRGGGEKGDDWYRGGYKSTKPNSWKDLIVCAEYLIEKAYTSSEKLGVTGYSAGGITVGRAIIERPYLFKAAVISAGSLNVLRHEKRLSKANAAEYGTLSDSLDFGYLLDMDVYHNIDMEQEYPAILFTAGLNDVRVVPSAPAKAVAKFQQSNKGENVMLFNVKKEGHSHIINTHEGIGFFLWQLGYPEFELK